jgi:hypothetical protein
MKGKILSMVIGSMFLVAPSGCTKHSSAPQVIVEIPSGFTGNFQLEMGVREAPPLQKRGAAYVVSVPRSGKVVTSTLLTDSQPTFQNSTDGAVWGYSLSLFKTGDGIPVGGRIEFFVGTKKEFEAEQGKKNHSQGVFTATDSIAWNLT